MTRRTQARDARGPWGFLTRQRSPLVGVVLFVLIFVVLPIAAFIVWSVSDNWDSALTEARTGMDSIVLPAGLSPGPVTVTQHQRCGDADSVAYSSVERVVRSDRAGADPLAEVAESVRGQGWVQRDGPTDAAAGSLSFHKEIGGDTLDLDLAPSTEEPASIRVTVGASILCN